MQVRLEKQRDKDTMITIELRCLDCWNWNKHHGDDESEPRDYVFTCFSDGHKHMIQYPGHYMTFEVYGEQEDD